MFPPSRVVTYDFDEAGRYVVNVGSIYTRSGANYNYLLRISETDPTPSQVDPATAVQAMIAGLQSRAFTPSGGGSEVTVASAPTVDTTAAAQSATPAADAPQPAPPGKGGLSIVLDAEPNDQLTTESLATALPAVIEGSIAVPGDVDQYRLTASAGSSAVIEIQSPRAKQPIFNPVARLLDSEGAEVYNSMNFNGGSISGFSKRSVLTLEKGGGIHAPRS